MPTYHLIVKGKVQGVFYRASAREVADSMGITGWVKNTEEGYVEILASGDENQLQQFINWCRKGPSQAIVTDVQVTEKPEVSFDRFRIDRF